MNDDPRALVRHRHGVLARSTGGRWSNETTAIDRAGGGVIYTFRSETVDDEKTRARLIGELSRRGWSSSDDGWHHDQFIPALGLLAEQSDASQARAMVRAGETEIVGPSFAARTIQAWVRPMLVSLFAGMAAMLGGMVAGQLQLVYLGLAVIIAPFAVLAMILWLEDKVRMVSAMRSSNKGGIDITPCSARLQLRDDDGLTVVLQLPDFSHDPEVERLVHGELEELA